MSSPPVYLTFDLAATCYHFLDTTLKSGDTLNSKYVHYSTISLTINNDLRWL